MINTVTPSVPLRIMIYKLDIFLHPVVGTDKFGSYLFTLLISVLFWFGKSSGKARGKPGESSGKARGRRGEC